MSNVIKFPRQRGFRGAVRSEVTSAMKSVAKPEAVVIVAIGGDGLFAIRAVYGDKIKEFDMYCRARATIERHIQTLMDDRDD